VIGSKRMTLMAEGRKLAEKTAVSMCGLNGI